MSIRCTVLQIISILNLELLAAQVNKTEPTPTTKTEYPANIPLILNTTGCKIYDFDVEYPKLPVKWGYECDKRLVEIYKSYDNVIKFKMLKPFDSCCYRTSSYSGMEKTDSGVTPCLPFTDGMAVPLTSDFISIGCNTKGEQYYTDRFAFVNRQNIKSLANKQAYSVLMVGIDSVSRYRAFQQLPRTIDYLLEDNWLDFKGYHKVDSDINPNIQAVMMGITHLPENCKSQVQCKHLMLITKYKEAGYITALGEDMAKRAVFYFNETLTDHYLTPFLRTSEMSKHNHSKCSAKIQSGAQVLSYALDFAKTYRFRRTFGYFWMSSFSHDTDYNLKSVDNALKNFFEELKLTGILERSFVLFFSAHGINLGISKQERFPENRLPMLFMWVPPKFSLKHSKLYKELVTNQNRLITHYNIYRTLYEILRLTNETVKPFTPYGCKYCTSLLQIIPETQTCLKAGLDVKYCGCNAIAISNTSGDAKESLKAALKYIERFALDTETLPCTMCERYTFDTLYKVRRLSYWNDSTVTLFVLTLNMQPNDTVFEVIIRKKVFIRKKVSRLLPNKNSTRAIKTKYYETVNLATVSEPSKDIDWCALYRRDANFCICMWDRPDCNLPSLYQLTQDLPIV